MPEESFVGYQAGASHGKTLLIMERQSPRWSEFAPLLKPSFGTGTRTERKVAKAADIADLREMGRRRTPKPVFDYVDGAAGDEISIQRSLDAFNGIYDDALLPTVTDRLRLDLELLAEEGGGGR